MFVGLLVCAKRIVPTSLTDPSRYLPSFQPQRRSHADGIIFEARTTGTSLNCLVVLSRYVHPENIWQVFGMHACTLSDDYSCIITDCSCEMLSC